MSLEKWAPPPPDDEFVSSSVMWVEEEAHFESLYLYFRTLEQRKEGGFLLS